jgi:O-antigen/teichoic acid export membrane protein
MTVESLKRRFPFLVNSAYATLTNGSNALLLVLLVVAGRWLSVDDYGRFQFALALTQIIENLMDIGLGPVTLRAVARDRDGADRLFRNVLGLKLMWVALGLAVLAGAAPLLRTDPAVIRVCYLMGASSALRSYLLTTRGLLQGLDRFDLEASLVVSDRVLLLVAGAAVLAGGYGLLGLALAFVLTRAGLLAVVLALVRRFLGPIAPRIDVKAWRELQSAALPLGLWLITLTTYNYIDAVILGVMRSDAEVGWYGAAYRLYDGLTYAPAIFSAVITPRLSSLFLTDRFAHRTLFRRTLLGSLAMGIVFGGIVWGAASWLLPFIFGRAYVPGVAPLEILSAGSVFIFATWILHAAAISIDLDHRLLITTLVGLVANVGLNIVLIPRYGISGAAWATVVAEALTASVLFLQVTRRLGEPAAVVPSASRG